MQYSNIAWLCFCDIHEKKNTIGYIMLLQERLLTSPCGYTLNTQQSNAVLELEDWWNYVGKQDRRSLTIEEKFIGLQGVPGSGKSTSIWTFVHRLLNKPEGRRIAIALAAPTHKAKSVLIDMAVENNILGCKITTLPSLLGMKADLDDQGEDEFVFSYRKLKLPAFDLVLADEASMYNAKQWNFMKGLDDCPPMIMIGDIDQLRPVKEKDKSQVFREVSRWITLTEPVRYDGAIKELVTAVKDSRYFVDPAKYADGNQIQILDQGTWIDRLASDIAEDTEGNGVRALAFTNKMVDWLNSVLHGEVTLRRRGFSQSRSFFDFPVEPGNIRAMQRVFQWDLPEIKEFEEGMWLVFNKPISRWDSQAKERVPVVKNGTIARVERVTHEIEEGFGCSSLVVHWKDTNEYGDIIPLSYIISVLDESEKKKFSDTLEDMRKEALKYENENHPIRRQIFRQRAKLRDAFASVAKTYASTVHKAQGSGYRKVYVHLADILKAQEPDIVKELIYTAYSRAKEQLVICL